MRQISSQEDIVHDYFCNVHNMSGVSTILIPFFLAFMTWLGGSNGNNGKSGRTCKGAVSNVPFRILYHTCIISQSHP